MKTTLFLAMAFVSASMAAATPYITKVFEYCPAPGQFVNELPMYEDGNSADDMVAKVQQEIAGDNKGMISLGALGGYVVFGFDHTIANVPGEYDFRVWGNAVPNTSEPGVIMVALDENGNGKPDDPWYEIAGSEYAKSKRIKITYSKPANDQDSPSWITSDGRSGTVGRNTFHTQPYYPQWIDGAIESQCVELPENYTFSNNTYYLHAFDFGYADNHPNTDMRSGIKIDWAVNADGSPANLRGVDFIKVISGLNQMCGPVGESSTEVCGAEDLHPDISGVSDAQLAANRVVLRGSNLCINSTSQAKVEIFAVSGALAARIEVSEGYNSVDISFLPSGIYVVRMGNLTARIVK